MNKIKLSKHEFENIVKDCKTIADFCRKVGLVPRGDNYKTFHRYVTMYETDISHFTGQRTNINNCLNKHNELKLNEYVNNDKWVKSSIVLKKMVNEKYKPYKCEICGIDEWNEKPIKLQLHHINGNHYDNRLENLQILCPNCHSQTDTFSGKNKKRYKNRLCSKCNKEISYYNNSGLCRDCYKKSQRNPNRPIKEILEKEIKTNSFRKLASKYNVCDKTIKKWCKQDNILF